MPKLARVLALICLAAPAWLTSNSSGLTEASITNDAVTHYAYCLNQARDNNFLGNDILNGDRYIIYRCHGEIAISYFNYLGRMKAVEFVAEEFNGTFIYRDIVGVGRCWHKIAEPNGVIVSRYGCDIFEEI